MVTKTNKLSNILQVASRRAQQQDKLRALQISHESNSSSPEFQIGQHPLRRHSCGLSQSNCTDKSDNTLPESSKNLLASRFTSNNDNHLKESSKSSLEHQHSNLDSVDCSNNVSFQSRMELDNKANQVDMEPFLKNTELIGHRTPHTMEMSTIETNALITRANAQIYPHTGNYNLLVKITLLSSKHFVTSFDYLQSQHLQLWIYLDFRLKPIFWFIIFLRAMLVTQGKLLGNCLKVTIAVLNLNPIIPIQFSVDGNCSEK